MVEVFYTGMLVVAMAAAGWFAFYVVYKLFKGQGQVLAPDGSGVEVHEDLRPLSWLIGRWVGVGTGQYPTIDDFRFGQEVVFSTDGRPFLSYLSRSWLLDDEGHRVRPLATEAGFWRPRPGNGIEVTLSHPTGFAEVWYGTQEVTSIVDATITGARADLTTDAVMRTASAKEYTKGHRLYGLVDGRLLWTFDMAAVGQPLLNHLAASLSRDDVTAQSTVDVDADVDADAEMAGGHA